MTNNSTNYTAISSPIMMSRSELIGWCFGYGIVCAFIIIDNTVAIVIFTSSRLLRKRTNYFLLSLSVADMMVGCISLPMYIVNFVSYHTTRSPDDLITDIYLVFDVFTGIASIFCLATIAMERLYSVALPNWHHTTPSYVYSIAVAIVWILATVLASFRLMFSLEVLSEEIMFNATMTSSFLSLAVIIIAYIGIGIKVKMRIHEKSKRTMMKDRKLAITLSIVTLIYIVTWLPLFGMNVAFRFCKKNDTTSNCGNVPAWVVSFSKLLQYANSFVNPIIYTFKIPEFRVALFQLVGRGRGRSASTLLSMRDMKRSRNNHHKNGNGNINSSFKKSRAESDSVM